MITYQTIAEKQFLITSLPESINSAYNIIFSQRRVELKPAMRLWKSKVKEMVPRFEGVVNEDLFRIEADFIYPFYYKNGKLRKFDTANLLKILYDAMSEKMGVDDSRFKFGEFSSVHGERESVKVMIQQLREEHE
jgi:Holliday junction resolvase RusA-like endonuclease